MSVTAGAFTTDDFYKIAVGCVAIVGAITGPVVARVVLHRQTHTQRTIADRAAIDNVSTKRQAWIDALRSDTADYLAQTKLFLRQIDRIRSDSTDEYVWRARLEASDTTEASITALRHRIQLRLNPTEQRHRDFAALIDKLAGLRDSLAVIQPLNEAELNAEFGETVTAIIATMQSILKEEWNRVRSGMP
ncbi:MAG: hypothetical protein ACTHL8_11140 [Burkholderiaceae bacterium]